MSSLRKILRIAVLSLVVFSSLSVVSDTYAYWASSVSGDTNTDATSVTVGTWTRQWETGYDYYVGDRVVNNGVIYEAKKDLPTREPGVSAGWKSEWTDIGPA